MDCDIAGKIYKGKHKVYGRYSWYDGRIITVLGWDDLWNGHHDEKRVVVKDSTGRIWSTAYEGVKAEIERQTAQ